MDELEHTRTELRKRVCPECGHQKEAGIVAAPEPRPCERDCDLFAYLPRLAAVVRRFGGEPPLGYPLAVLNLPCRTCSPMPRACDEGCRTERPLRRFAAEAMALLETMAREGRV